MIFKDQGNHVKDFAKQKIKFETRMFPIVNMSTPKARSYKINKTPTQAFTPHASNMKYSAG